MHGAGCASLLDETDASVSPPRNLLGWLAFLWSQVLFAGRKPSVEPLKLSNTLVVLLLPAVLLYGSMAFPLFEPDEGRYAEIPREMLVRGEWIVPYLQGEPYLDKPPLLYWLVMLSYRLLGVYEFAARLVPAVAVHGSILLTYFFGRRSLGERAAFWGALLLGLAPGFVSIGRLLILDGLLTFWVALALFAGFEALRGERFRLGWWLLAAVGCGLGILAKGPVALLLLAPPLWAYRRLTPASGRIGWLPVFLFAATVLAVAGPWYFAICVRLPGFAQYFLWKHNVMRFVAPFDHQRPIWFYGPVLLGGLLPGTLLVIPFLRFLLALDKATAQRRCQELGFFVLAGLWCILFFSMSGSKLPTYILPAFPPLALALGYYLSESRWQRSLWPKGLATLTATALFVGHFFLLPWYANYRAPLGRRANLKEFCQDLHTPVVCYPRNCDSVSFYVGRDDLTSYRSKQTHLLVYSLLKQPRTVVLLTHRHSLQALRYALPPELEIVEQKHFGLQEIPGLPETLMQVFTGWMGETALGLCDLAVVEHRSKERLLAD